jgi:hypothetical protein
MVNLTPSPSPASSKVAGQTLCCSNNLYCAVIPAFCDGQHQADWRFVSYACQGRCKSSGRWRWICESKVMMMRGVMSKQGEKRKSCSCSWSGPSVMAVKPVGAVCGERESVCVRERLRASTSMCACLQVKWGGSGPLVCHKDRRHACACLGFCQLMLWFISEQKTLHEIAYYSMFFYQVVM